jgi:DNA-binding transcriptional MerR regulator
MAEYRIDDLARAAGTTTRNVRAYQDRGLLPPPRRSGRIGLYDDGHLARLRLIASMLTRGYNTAQIAELITAWEQSKDITDVLGVEQAVTDRWSEDAPLTIDTTAVRELLGDSDLYERLVGLGLITATDSDAATSLIASPQLVNVFVELVGFGFTAAQAVELHERITPLIERLAREMVGSAADLIIAEHGAAWVPDGDELGPFTETLHQMRALAMSSMQVNFAKAMESTVDEVLGEHIQRVISASAGADESDHGAA